MDWQSDTNQSKILITVTSYWARWSLESPASTDYSGADQRKHQSSTSLAFMRGIHRSPVNSPHKRPVTRKMFPFDDVIMKNESLTPDKYLLLNSNSLFLQGIVLYQGIYQGVTWGQSRMIRSRLRYWGQFNLIWSRPTKPFFVFIGSASYKSYKRAQPLYINIYIYMIKISAIYTLPCALVTL